MHEESFVRYIGDYRVHDSRIKAIESDQNTLQVSLRSEDNEIIIVKFVGVKSVSSNRPEGMILYSISEMKEQSPFRKFVFVNWNDDDDASLEIISQDCIIQ
ncbi:hypothetical protein [Clostridium ganghwense]|uniref:Uncharacterized protein n=1 Tax=Clostridium ganghwense TaxID=312089 RepID=A0ABT4CT09_9CLOT|nr:hypothetical protein [Clostridium ganghwense]MCY6372200.1 hypothetical protein [Clostridium ganghwense]